MLPHFTNFPEKILSEGSLPSGDPLIKLGQSFPWPDDDPVRRGRECPGLARNVARRFHWGSPARYPLTMRGHHPPGSRIWRAIFQLPPGQHRCISGGWVGATYQEIPAVMPPPGLPWRFPRRSFPPHERPPAYLDPGRGGPGIHPQGQSPEIKAPPPYLDHSFYPLQPPGGPAHTSVHAIMGVRTPRRERSPGWSP